MEEIRYYVEYSYFLSMDVTNLETEGQLNPTENHQHKRQDFQLQVK